MRLSSQVVERASTSSPPLSYASMPDDASEQGGSQQQQQQQQVTMVGKNVVLRPPGPSPPIYVSEWRDLFLSAYNIRTSFLRSFTSFMFLLLASACFLVFMGFIVHRLGRSLKRNSSIKETDDSWRTFCTLFITSFFFMWVDWCLRWCQWRTAVRNNKVRAS